MSTTVDLARSFDFDGQSVRLIEQDGETYIPRADVTRALGYANPDTAATLIMNRNPDDFVGCHTPIKLIGVTGAHETVGLTERGVYAMAFLAKSKAATQFRRRVAELLEAIRRGKVVLTDPYRSTELEIEKIRAMTEQRRVDLEMTRLNALGGFLAAHAGRVAPTHLTAIVQSMTGHAVHTAKTYTATEVAEKMSLQLNQNISANLVGRVANALKIKPPEGQENDLCGYTVTKARGIDRTVYAAFYKGAALEHFDRYFKLNPVKSRKAPPLPIKGLAQLELEMPAFPQKPQPQPLRLASSVNI